MEDPLTRNEDRFQKFLSYCKKVLIEEAKPVALMKLIKKRYYDCDEDFTDSDEFYDHLISHHEKMLKDRGNFSLYLKQFLDILKSRKVVLTPHEQLRCHDTDNTSGSELESHCRKKSTVNGEVERSRDSDEHEIRKNDTKDEKSQVDGPSEKSQVDGPSEKSQVDGPSEKSQVDGPSEKSHSPDSDNEARKSILVKENGIKKHDSSDGVSDVEKTSISTERAEKDHISDEQRTKDKQSLSDEIVVGIRHSSELDIGDTIGNTTDRNGAVETTENLNAESDEESVKSLMGVTVRGQSVNKYISTTVGIESLSEDESETPSLKETTHLLSLLGENDPRLKNLKEKPQASWLATVFDKKSLSDTNANNHESDFSSDNDSKKSNGPKHHRHAHTDDPSSSKKKQCTSSSFQSGKRKREISSSSSEDKSYHKSIKHMKGKGEKRYKKTVGKCSITKTHDIPGVSYKRERLSDTCSSGEDESYKKRNMHKKENVKKCYKISPKRLKMNPNGKSSKQSPPAKSPILIVTDSESENDIVKTSNKNMILDAQKIRQYGINIDPKVKLVRVKVESGVAKDESNVKQPVKIANKSDLKGTSNVLNNSTESDINEIKGNESATNENSEVIRTGNETELIDKCDLDNENKESHLKNKAEEKQKIKRIPLITEALYDGPEAPTTNKADTFDENQRDSSESDDDNNEIPTVTNSKAKRNEDPDGNPGKINDSSKDESNMEVVVESNITSKAAKPKKDNAHKSMSEDDAEPGTSTSDGTKKGSSKQILRLEKLLEQIRDKIEEVRNKELDLDDLNSNVSDYLLEDKLEQKFMKVWTKLCELHNSASSTGRPTEKYFRYQGTRYKDVNRKIEKFINKRKVFPDFHDIKNIIIKVNKDKKLHLSTKLVNDLAQEAFLEVGNKLQSRRKRDFAVNLGSHKPWHGKDKDEDVNIFSVYNDPALYDKELKRKLDANKKLAKSGIEKVVDRYARLQYEVGEEEEEEEEDDEEEEEEGDQPSRDIDMYVTQLLDQDEGLDSDGETRVNDLNEFYAPITREKKEKNQPQQDNTPTDNFMELFGLQKTSTADALKIDGQQTVMEDDTEKASEIHIISIESDEEEPESGKTGHYLKDEFSNAKKNNEKTKITCVQATDDGANDQTSNLKQKNNMKGASVNLIADSFTKTSDSLSCKETFVRYPFKRENRCCHGESLDTNPSKTLHSSSCKSRDKYPHKSPISLSHYKHGADIDSEDLIVIDDDEAEFHGSDNYNKYHDDFYSNQYGEGDNYNQYQDESYDKYYADDNYAQYENGEYDQYPVNDQYYNKGNHDHYEENQIYNEYVEYPHSSENEPEVVVLDPDESAELHEEDNAPLNIIISSPRHITEDAHLDIKDLAPSHVKTVNSVTNGANQSITHKEISLSSPVSCIEIDLDEESLSGPPDIQGIITNNSNSYHAEAVDLDDIVAEKQSKSVQEGKAKIFMKDEDDSNQSDEGLVGTSTSENTIQQEKDRAVIHEKSEVETISRESENKRVEDNPNNLKVAEEEIILSDSEIEEGETSPIHSENEDDLSDDWNGLDETKTNSPGMPSNLMTINKTSFSQAFEGDDDSDTHVSDEKFIATPLKLHKNSKVITNEKDEMGGGKVKEGIEGFLCEDEVETEADLVEDEDQDKDVLDKVDDVQFDEDNQYEGNDEDVSKVLNHTLDDMLSVQTSQDYVDCNDLDINEGFDNNFDVNTSSGVEESCPHLDRLNGGNDDTEEEIQAFGANSKFGDSGSDLINSKIIQKAEEKNGRDSQGSCLSVAKLDDELFTENDNNDHESIPDMFYESSVEDKTNSIENKFDGNCADVKKSYENVERDVGVNEKKRDEDNDKNVEANDEDSTEGIENNADLSDSKVTHNEEIICELVDADDVDYESKGDCVCVDDKENIEGFDRDNEDEDAGSHCSESLLSTVQESSDPLSESSDKSENRLSSGHSPKSHPMSDSNISESRHYTKRTATDIIENEIETDTNIMCAERSSGSSNCDFSKNKGSEEKRVDYARIALKTELAEDSLKHSVSEDEGNECDNRTYDHVNEVKASPIDNEQSEGFTSKSSEVSGKITSSLGYIVKLKHPDVRNKMTELGKLLKPKQLSEEESKHSQPVTDKTNCVSSNSCFMLNDDDEHLELIEQYKEPKSRLVNNRDFDDQTTVPDVIELSDSD